MSNKRKTVKKHKRLVKNSGEKDIIRSDSGTKPDFWGYHLILNCTDCDKDAIRSKPHIRAFLKKVIDITDMKAWGKPIIMDTKRKPIFMALENGERPDLFGISVVQLIHTSSITIHFMNDTGDAYFDFFSCKNFEPKKVTECFREFFNPSKVQPTFLIRDTAMD